MARRTRRNFFGGMPIDDDLLLKIVFTALADGDFNNATNILAAVERPGQHTRRSLEELAASLRTAPDDVTRRLVGEVFWSLAGRRSVYVGSDMS